MSEGPSVEAFVRTINDKSNDFLTKIRQFYLAIAGTNEQERVERANAALSAAQILWSHLAPPDRPPWLRPFIDSLQRFVQAPKDSNVRNKVIETYGEHFAAVLSHQWKFAPVYDDAIDFDAIFKEVKAESRISELFDRIIDILEKIIQTDLIDSRRVTASLEKIIATLRKNRKGSYFSMICSWQFLKRFMVNAAWNAVSKIPGIDVLSESLRDTIKEFDGEMEKVYERIATEASEAANVDFVALEYTQLAIALDSGLNNNGETVDVEAEQ